MDNQAIESIVIVHHVKSQMPNSDAAYASGLIIVLKSVNVKIGLITRKFVVSCHRQDQHVVYADFKDLVGF
jgi:hypothetical protein